MSAEAINPGSTITVPHVDSHYPTKLLEIDGTTWFVFIVVVVHFDTALNRWIHIYSPRFTTTLRGEADALIFGVLVRSTLVAGSVYHVGRATRVFFLALLNSLLDSHNFLSFASLSVQPSTPKQCAPSSSVPRRRLVASDILDVCPRQSRHFRRNNHFRREKNRHHYADPSADRSQQVAKL